MRWGPKTLLAALVVLLLGTGLVACGGDDSGTDTTDSVPSQTSAEGGGTTELTPTQHQDSGGGSDQYLVKGGDNSIQEFGEEGEGSDFDEAATALHDFLDARAAGAWATACENIAPSVIDSLEELAAGSKGATCAAILRKLTNPAAKDLLREEAEAADVGSLRVEDERGFVLFRGPDGEVLAVPMAREDGSWKVAALASTPLS